MRPSAAAVRASIERGDALAYLRSNRRERLYYKVFGHNPQSVIERRMHVAYLLDREAMLSAREKGV